MSDRSSLSKANGKRWVDNQGNTYIYFTVKELAERFRCSEDKAGKIMKELENYNLIVRTRQGQGKPCRVVVKSVVQSSEKAASRTKKKGFPDLANSGGNKTNKNNKYINNLPKRELDRDEILAAQRMVNSDDYFGNNGNNDEGGQWANPTG